MDLLNPKKGVREYQEGRSGSIMERTIAWFEKRGKARLKEADHEREWYGDFLEFIGQEGIFHELLCPPEYGGPNSRWDTWRNMEFNEILGFYGLAYWYTWQVSILGLGPIWMGDNEAVKKKTGQFLKDGGIFAFGLSEKEHGADIYSTEVALHPQEDGTWLARGSKYYIGNANEAALVSVFARFAGSDEYVFFVVDPKHEKYECVKNVVNSQNYVAEFTLHDYPIGEADILCRGREAWDTSLNTVNVGKYNLGWASIGICTHAFHETINHASKRRLFDHTVTDFPHVQQFFVDAWCRLMGMKLFATRAGDYMRSASLEDRRYLLYDPMVKMKVTTQGEEVVNLLWEIMAAKGFEKDMYFEMAARDIRALPKLEGTVHVNMALIIKFMKNYFFKPGSYAPVPEMKDPVHDAFLFAQGPTKGLGKITFHDYKPVYAAENLPNVAVFRSQISRFKQLLMAARPSKEQAKDFDFLLILGELFTLVVYGQLLLEARPIHAIDDDVTDQIFDFMIRDFSKFALQLYSKTGATALQRFFCMRMIRKPVVDRARFERVWARVKGYEDAYEMAP